MFLPRSFHPLVVEIVPEFHLTLVLTPIGESRSTPGEFANVEIPVTTISDSDGFLFEFVNDLIQVNVLWKNIHEQISGTNRKEARPFVRTPKKGRLNGVNGINVAGDARNT